MAEAITIKDLQDGRVDVKTIGEYANEDKIVESRLGKTYPSGPMASRLILAQGKIDKVFANTTQMTNSSLPVGSFVLINDSISSMNGYYQKNQSGSWLKTKWQGGGGSSSPVLTGQQIYNQASGNPNSLFSAIWSEYNKPVWHTGGLVFVDSVGAKVKVAGGATVIPPVTTPDVIPPVVPPVDPNGELIMTLKATSDNQQFILPLGNVLIPDGTSLNVNWGDGETSTLAKGQSAAHQYTNAIGDLFRVTIKGVMRELVFPVFTAPSNFMLISIDKNTLPKIMDELSFSNCVNLQTVCDGAFSSYAGTSLNLMLMRNTPKLTLSSGMFDGLSQVTNIDNLFSNLAYKLTKSLPAGILDVFTDVTSAKELFYGASVNLPIGILDKMTKLRDITSLMQTATVTTIDSNMFKNQSQLNNVTSAFNVTITAVADAETLYNDMKRGNPTLTEKAFFGTPLMTNKDKIPEDWGE